jgi:hypothetical protein
MGVRMGDRRVLRGISGMRRKYQKAAENCVMKRFKCN